MWGWSTGGGSLNSSCCPKSYFTHPSIYMRGVRSENLMAMLDFFYQGPANFYPTNVDTFLVLAEELKMKGFRGNQSEKEAEENSQPIKQKSFP